MRSMRLAGAAALLVISACAGNAPLAGGPTSSGIVKVSLVDVFSGTSSSSGQNLRNSLQAEVDQINTHGGLLGSQVEVVAADDESRPDKGAELVREQVADRGVKLMVGPNSTDVYLAARHFITQARVPNCLSAGVTDADVRGAPSTFRTQGRDEDRVAALIRYLQRNQPGVNKIGLIADDDDSGHGLDTLMASQAGGPLKAAGITYVGAALTPLSATDFTPYVQQLVAAGAQAVVLSNEPTTAVEDALAVDQAGQTGKVTLLGIGGVDTYSYPTTGGPAAVGTVFASTIQAYLTGAPQSRWPPAYRDFVRTITSQYGYASNGVEIQGSPAAADCILQWAKAVRKAGTFDGPSVVRAWEGLDLAPSESVLGVREAPRNHNSVPASGIFVYQWARQGSHFQLKQLS
jgi:ABC-type branched-subunit amino acid transport system substrate-binding protein